MAASSRWHKLRALSLQERRILAQAWLLLPVVAIHLRLFGFAATSRRLQPTRQPQKTRPAGDTMPHALKLSRLVGIAGRHHVADFACLTRSLVAWAMLQSHGIAAELKIGVRKQAGKFQAHAWVEVDGQVVNDNHRVTEEYAAFADGLI